MCTVLVDFYNVSSHKTTISSFTWWNHCLERLCLLVYGFVHKCQSIWLRALFTFLLFVHVEPGGAMEWWKYYFSRLSVEEMESEFKSYFIPRSNDYFLL